MTDSDKLTCALKYGNYYARKKFYSAGPGLGTTTLSITTFKIMTLSITITRTTIMTHRMMTLHGNAKGMVCFIV